MEAFGDMIDTRERAYAERLPRVDALLGSGAVEQAARSARASSRAGSTRSRAAQDVAALGSAEEREQWARIQRSRPRWPRAPDTQEKRRAARAAAPGEGRAVFPPQRFLQGADVAAAPHHEGSRSGACTKRRTAGSACERARKSVPTNNGEFAARVAALKARIEALAGPPGGDRAEAERLSGAARGRASWSSRRTASRPTRCRRGSRWRRMYDRAANPEPAKKPQDRQRRAAGVDPPPPNRARPDAAGSSAQPPQPRADAAAVRPRSRRPRRSPKP